ncbi:MAG: hypothetical protein ABRQ25_08735 [Clostridiaceae bacterium]
MKKKLSLLLALALAFSIPIAATATTTPEIEWSKSFGGSGYDSVISSQQTTDGGYIMAVQSDSNDGDVTGNHGGYDYWIVKLTKSGAISWSKCLGGSGSDDVYGIQQTSDGGYIAAGASGSKDGDVAGNHGGYDAWIVKLTSNGEISWSKCLGGSNADCAYSIQQTNDGGYIVAGVSNSNDGDVSGNHGYNDYWVVKLNSNGEISWSKCLGGSGFDGTRIIQQTRDGGYCAACYSDSTDGDITKNHGIVDYWVAKFDNNVIYKTSRLSGGFYLYKIWGSVNNFVQTNI